MATVSRALRHNLFLWGCHSILLGSLALLFHLSSAKPPPTPLSPCAFHLSWPPKSFPRYPPDAAAPGRTEQQPGKRPEPQKATRKKCKNAPGKTPDPAGPGNGLIQIPVNLHMEWVRDARPGKWVVPKSRKNNCILNVLGRFSARPRLSQTPPPTHTCTHTWRPPLETSRGTACPIPESGENKT